MDRLHDARPSFGRSWLRKAGLVAFGAVGSAVGILACGPLAPRAGAPPAALAAESPAVTSAWAPAGDGGSAGQAGAPTPPAAAAPISSAPAASATGAAGPSTAASRGSPDEAPPARAAGGGGPVGAPEPVSAGVPAPAEPADAAPGAAAPPIPASALPIRDSFEAGSTAYCLKGKTRTGVRTRNGIIAADPAVLPLGSVVRLSRPSGEALGIFVVMDTGGAVKGRKVDVYLADCAKAKRWGRKPLRVEVIDIGL